MSSEIQIDFKLHPHVQHLIEKSRPDWQLDDLLYLSQHHRINQNGKLDNLNSIIISCSDDAEDVLEIDNLPIRSLFRGTFDPGELGNTEDPKYMYIITYVENHWCSYVEKGLFPIPRDKEMEEIYSQLRRRPDSPRNFANPLYALIWQLFAFAAIKLEISEAEFNAIVSRLIHSSRVFYTSIRSTNMYDRLSGLYNK